ncbi:hypothetical protein ABPG74_018032 [Tetrahymena malaccensis]
MKNQQIQGNKKRLLEYQLKARFLVKQQSIKQQHLIEKNIVYSPYISSKELEIFTNQFSETIKSSRDQIQFIERFYAHIQAQMKDVSQANNQFI